MTTYAIKLQGSGNFQSILRSLKQLAKPPTPRPGYPARTPCAIYDGETRTWMVEARDREARKVVEYARHWGAQVEELQ